MGYAFIPAGWATCGKALTPYEKAVMQAIAAHADKDGKAWPSISRIVAESGVSHGLAVKCVAELERKGAMRAERLPGRHTTYWILDTSPCYGLVRAVDQSVRRTPPVRTVDTTRPYDDMTPVRTTDTKDPKKDPIEGSQEKDPIPPPAQQTEFALATTNEKPTRQPTISQQRAIERKANAKRIAEAWNEAMPKQPPVLTMRGPQWDRLTFQIDSALSQPFLNRDADELVALFGVFSTDPWENGEKRPRTLAQWLAPDHLATTHQKWVNNSRGQG